MVSLLWVIIGYSLAFSEGGPLLGGLIRFCWLESLKVRCRGISRVRFRHVSNDIRHYHASTHCGRFRRANAVFLDVDLLGAVAIGGLRAYYPLGMGGGWLVRWACLISLVVRWCTSQQGSQR